MSRHRFGCPALAVAAGAALLAVPPRPVQAQRRPEPQLLLTIMGGATSGGTLYTNVRQPLDLIEDPSAIDTLGLGRSLSGAITVGASATYFPNPSVGLTAEISFMAYGRDDTCGMLYTAPTAARAGWNEEICDNIAAIGGTASTIAFEAGGTFRALPHGAVKPYLRGQVGIAVRNASTVELVGTFHGTSGAVQNRLIIADPDGSSVFPSATAGVGVMFPFAAGYQARLEFRDKLLLVDRISGPADAFAVAPTERTLINSLGLVFMLDIVLEQRRGRRY